MAFTQYNYIPNHYNDTENKPMTQQEYAEKAYRKIREKILPQAPANVLVSYAFPKGGKGKEKRLGECFTGEGLPEGIAAVIFVRPSEWKDAITVLDTLTHEAIHAALPPKTGHKGAFVKLSKEIGLTNGKPKYAGAGPELLERLNAIAYELGDFPAASFDFENTREKQTTRLRLYECRCDPADAKEEGRTNKIRCGSDSMDMTCNVCEARFEIKEKEEKE